MSPRDLVVMGGTLWGKGKKDLTLVLRSCFIFTFHFQDGGALTFRGGNRPIR